MKSTALAEKTAATRAIEMIFPKETRLYSDEYSYQFLSTANRLFVSAMKAGFVGRMFMKFSEKIAPGVYGGIISRTRYMDDVLEAAIEGEFDAVVNLGGGYDTKCLRFDLAGANYYHVDQPAVVGQYRKLMSKLDSGIPEGVHFVPIDFNNQSLEEELKKVGFDGSMKTLYLWEGVTQYITMDAVRSTLDFISKTAEGSRVVFTYVVKALIDNPESYPKYKTVLKRLKLLDAEWISGFEPDQMPSFLKEHGMELIEDVGRQEYQDRYFKPIDRKIEIMPIERIAFARVVK